MKKAFKQWSKEPFVKMKSPGEFPSLREVQYTNQCAVGLHWDSRANRIIVISAIDNLIKGASGQAVQNMNIRYGFPETEGLPLRQKKRLGKCEDAER